MPAPSTVLSDVRAVELQVNLKESERRPVLGALGIDAQGAEVSQIVLVDSPGLELLRGGVVVSARRTQDRTGGVAVTLLLAGRAWASSRT